MSLGMQRGNFTYEDLCAMPDDDLRHEILFGEHLVTPSPRIRHQLLVTRLLNALDDSLALSRHGAARGLLLVGPCDVLLESGDVLVPDLLYLSPERMALAEERYVRGAPDLAVEVLSPST